LINYNQFFFNRCLSADLCQWLCISLGGRS